MSEELNAGIKMVIDRMQTNPYEFEYGGKMYEYANMAAELMDKSAHQRLWFLSAADKKALVTAYTDMHKQRFTTGVVQTIFDPKPEYDINMDRPYKIPSTIIAPKNMLKQAKEILDKEFEKEYAKISRT
jgi:hypothetical protein